MSSPIDWEATHEAVIKYLSVKLCPAHYRTVYDSCAIHAARGVYSVNTDQGEKLRQYYAEHDRPDVAAFPGGFIGLRRWFSDPRQAQLIQPPERVLIRGQCVVSYDAGFEQAKRQNYMQDKQNDAHTTHRHDRRRRAALVESHVKDFFKYKYPEFYRPASNEGQYSQYAYDDFGLDYGDGFMLVDVKSWTNERGFMPDPKKNIMYLWADWISDKEKGDAVQLNGFISGAWARVVCEQGDKLWTVERNHVFSIDQFLVFLNMRRHNLDRKLYIQHLRKPNNKTAYAPNQEKDYGSYYTGKLGGA